MVKLDKKTTRILYELSNNSRISLKQLAKKASLSSSSTLYRLKSLFEDRIIIGTTPIIDHSKLGYLVYRAYFNFFGTTPKKEEEIINWLKNQEEVSVLATSTGSYEILIMSFISSHQKFHEFIKRFKVRYRKYVTNLDTFTYLKTYHFSRNYLIDEKNSDYLVVIGESEIEKIDELDRKILRAISKDARKPILQISEEVKSPVRTVANRLRMLEKRKIIAGYTINIDLAKINREYFKLNIVSNDNFNYDSLIHFAKNLDSSIYVDETIGKYDFELNIEVKNKEELFNIINLIKENMNGVRELNMFQIKKYIKLSYLGI